MDDISNNARARGADENGQSLVEYMLIIVLIAIFVMVAVPPIGDFISSAFSEVTAAM